jgi:hypothetical protein
MATITKGKTFVNGELVTPANLHQMVDAATVANIVNADISAAAAIADTKLAQITTAGKVANSATTATNASTANAIVARDGSGNFSAGTITANLTGNVTGNASTATTATTAAACSGNAATATTLQTARTINGVSFNGSANITVTAAPNAHTHDDRYYTETEIDSKLSGLPVGGHTHDDRYYTETEMNTLLAGKQASGSYAPATGIAPSAITGTAVITTDSRLSDARTPTTHTHDDRYYTETEMNTLLAGKQASGSYAAASHTHSAADITSGTLTNSRTTATSNNTVNAIVARDVVGDFSARVITVNGLKQIYNSTAVFSATNLGAGSGQGCQVDVSHTDGMGDWVPFVSFNYANSSIGSIKRVSASSVAYTTTSDYRLKTNIEPLTAAVARLLQIPVHRFNWLADPTGQKVDGFLAHEAQAVVPESVTGTKDGEKTEEYEVTPAVKDENGGIVTPAVMGTRTVPDYQGIDQSKLVPLLVAAVQELSARVAALEAK